MQDTASTIAFVGILVFLAHLFTSIFRRTKIPDVLFLVIIGICVGPVLGLTSPDLFGAVGPVFTIITLIIILFESGLTLKLNTIRSALGGAMILAPLTFFSTMGIVAGFALWLTDLEPVEVYAISNCLHMPVDVNSALTIRFANGAVAGVSVSGSAPATDQAPITLAGEGQGGGYPGLRPPGPPPPGQPDGPLPPPGSRTLSLRCRRRPMGSRRY